MVSIGTGPGDPRAWIRAAYTLIEAAEAAATGDKLPAPSDPAHAAYMGREGWSFTIMKDSQSRRTADHS